MFTEMNKTSTKKFDYDCGHVMTLNDFIEACDQAALIDYDGHAGEILLGDNIIYEKPFYPSDLDDHAGTLLKLQEEIGELKIVWYNK